MLSTRSLNGFEEIIVVTVIELEFVCQTRTFFFFKSEHVLFFLTRSLIDRCQIVTGTYRKKCFKIRLEAFQITFIATQIKVLRWSLSLICIISVLTTIYSLKNYIV